MPTLHVRPSAPVARRLLAGLLVAVCVAAGGTAQPAGAAEASPAAQAAQAAQAAETPERDPVIFVHGLYGSPSNFLTMQFTMWFSGYWGTPLVGFDYNSLGSMTDAAEELAAEVDDVLADSGADRVDIVTHSLGGLPSRYFIKFLGGTAQVDDWVSLGGPNQGGDPGTCPAPGSVACRDAVKGSPFITQLISGDQTPGDVTYTTFASPCDNVVDAGWTPVDGGVNRTVGCVSHFNLVSDRTIIGDVIDTLNS